MEDQEQADTTPGTEGSAPPPAAPPTSSVRLNVFSPTLRDLSRDLWPEKLTACMQCPNAMWQQTGTDLICYCRVMYRTTWSKGQPTEILACDGTSLGQEEEEQPDAE